jgi:lipopolysaccharide transport system ATP-binding protein
MRDNTIAVSCHRIGKRYRLGSAARYATLRETITGAPARIVARARARREQPRGADPPGTLWALRDVSFDIAAGESVAIIGRNGAGKTTLLKILSRITPPTIGDGVVHGRIGSLLEVGTGFHPELTGRENVFLNGAILGMRQRAIAARFDEIIDFAGVEAFVDTPVKRFSAGMYLRLAFSVAAHLEPDVLVIDEILSVGDLEFQRKCMGKVGEVGRSGRTVLFVSHNLGLVKELCTRGIVLDAGRLIADAPITEAIASYLRTADPEADASDLTRHPRRPAAMQPILRRAVIRNESGTAVSVFTQRDQVVVDIEYDASGQTIAGVGIILETSDGVRVGNVNTYMSQSPPYRLPSAGRVRFLLEGSQLVPDQYFISVSVGASRDEILDRIERVVAFTVFPADIYGSGYMMSRDDGLSVFRASARVETLHP